MIGYLKGTIILTQKDWVIINTGTVGYKVFASISTLDPTGEVELYIYTAISQDSTRLFGFSTPEELRVFELLMEVQGVGPKLAQQIIIKLGIEKIQEAINTVSATIFSTVPKVGPKLATKIIVELKDKLKWGQANDIINRENEYTTVIAALEQLGYKSAEFAELLNKIPKEKQSDSEKIRWILSELALS